MATWGLPYRGSKSKIAEKIILLLPVGHRFVDLFGGGGAMSHCATRYYRQVLYNDVDPLTVEYFSRAMSGDYDIRWINRAEFNDLEISNMDYRDYVYQDGDIVYCDIPYASTEGYDGTSANTDFDTEAFLEWVRTRPYQVYFSSYSAPDEFYKEEIATVTAFSGDKAHQARRTENLYSNGKIRKTIWEIIDDYSERTI
jgi:site-specific DNA-adenine methylase